MPCPRAPGRRCAAGRRNESSSCRRAPRRASDREEQTMKRIASAIAALAALAAAPAAAATLDDVKARGTLRCGVAPNAPGFAAKDAQGTTRGFDIDFCRAVAAAVLG